MNEVVAGALPIGFGQLCLCLAFVGVVGGTSLVMSLGLARSLFWGAARTVAQLTLMGYVLRCVFVSGSGWLVALMCVLMAWFAARIVRGRVGARNAAYFWPGFFIMQVVFLLVASYVAGAIARAEPWWNPRYFIPLTGMLAGNAMNALALALDRYFSGLESRRAEHELLLTLGASAAEASAPALRAALRAGMTPSINNMMGAGIVSIPGMMTGQILGGGDPAQAARYQIVVMLMMAATAALVCLGVLLVVRRRCFTPWGTLRPAAPR